MRKGARIFGSSTIVCILVQGALSSTRTRVKQRQVAHPLVVFVTQAVCSASHGGSRPLANSNELGEDMLASQPCVSLGAVPFLCGTAKSCAVEVAACYRQPPE